MSLDLDAVRKLNVQPGDMLLVPEDVDLESMEELANALRKVNRRGKVLIIRGLDMQKLPETEMNAAGWYRR